ncbi:hypothetical protein [Microbispora maris]|uniref:hypothetical protein n=1 Tax=Microbispora maris TaxID=3144104 RepID=UPI0031FD296F
MSNRPASGSPEPGSRSAMTVRSSGAVMNPGGPVSAVAHAAPGFVGGCDHHQTPVDVDALDPAVVDVRREHAPELETLATFMAVPATPWLHHFFALKLVGFPIPWTAAGIAVVAAAALEMPSPSRTGSQRTGLACS